MVPPNVSSISQLINHYGKSLSSWWRCRQALDHDVKWNPWSPPFVPLVLLSMSMTVRCIPLSQDHFFNVLAAIGQALALVNSRFQSRSIQLISHDIFVWLAVYGHIFATDHHSRIHVAVLTSLMLTSRAYFGYCIFLWWNRVARTSRDRSNDIVASFLLVYNLLRTPPLLDQL